MRETEKNGGNDLIWSKWFACLSFWCIIVTKLNSFSRRGLQIKLWIQKNLIYFAADVHPQGKVPRLRGARKIPAHASGWTVVTLTVHPNAGSRSTGSLVLFSIWHLSGGNYFSAERRRGSRRLPTRVPYFWLSQLSAAWELKEKAEATGAKSHGLQVWGVRMGKIWDVHFRLFFRRQDFSLLLKGC